MVEIRNLILGTFIRLYVFLQTRLSDLKSSAFRKAFSSKHLVLERNS